MKKNILEKSKVWKGVVGRISFLEYLAWYERVDFVAILIANFYVG
jgi:hypothetical protein